MVQKDVSSAGTMRLVGPVIGLATFVDSRSIRWPDVTKVRINELTMNGLITGGNGSCHTRAKGRSNERRWRKLKEEMLMSIVKCGSVWQLTVK